MLFRFVLRSLFLYFGFLFCWFSVWLLRKWRKCDSSIWFFCLSGFCFEVSWERIWTKYYITFHFFLLDLFLETLRFSLLFLDFLGNKKDGYVCIFLTFFFWSSWNQFIFNRKKNRISVVITISCSFLGYRVTEIFLVFSLLLVNLCLASEKM